MLELMQRAFHGPARSPTGTIDLGPRELIVLGALALLVLALGLFPQPVLESSRLPLGQLVIRDVTFDPADPGLLRDRARTAGLGEQEPKP